MAVVNVPFDLEPWCEGCDRLEQVNDVFFMGEQRKTLRVCKHLAICRRAVKSALRPLSELRTPFPEAEPVRPKTGLDRIREMGVEEILDLFLHDCPCPPPMATVSCDGSIGCRLCWIRYLDNPEGTVMIHAQPSQ